MKCYFHRKNGSMFRIGVFCRLASADAKLRETLITKSILVRATNLQIAPPWDRLTSVPLPAVLLMLGLLFHRLRIDPHLINAGIGLKRGHRAGIFLRCLFRSRFIMRKTQASGSYAEGVACARMRHRK